MFEEDLKILDNQIARAREALKKARNMDMSYQLEKRIKAYEDMRLDLLIQIKNARSDTDEWSTTYKDRQ